MSNKLVCPSLKPQHMGHHWREIGNKAVCLRPKCKATSKSIFKIPLEEERGVAKWGMLYTLVKLFHKYPLASFTKLLSLVYNRVVFDDSLETSSFQKYSIGLYQSLSQGELLCR